ncbi:MAG TPA: hypothetical protein PLS03_00085 [Terrimicrobiaceae bacterium]|nr:hypothetical protein [Terrimicrobiaceae bacterium]
MDKDPEKNPDRIDLPTPTAWPIVAAFGLTLLFFGLVTNLTISLVGFLVGLVGAVGWALDVFPHPKHIAVIPRPEERPAPVKLAGRAVQILGAGKVPHRARIPMEVSPYTAGVVGGLIGGAVMAGLACLYGVFWYGSVWYPINLLAAAGVPELASASLESLKNFSAAGLIVGTIAHVSLSVLVGLLYVVLLPMLPQHTAWLWGGIVTPLLWTGLIFASLRMINPTLASAIDWPWFVACQVAFGAVCGFVVFKSTKVETMQNWSLAEKLGVEAQHETEDDR